MAIEKLCCRGIVCCFVGMSFDMSGYLTIAARETVESEWRSLYSGDGGCAVDGGCVVDGGCAVDGGWAVDGG